MSKLEPYWWEAAPRPKLEPPPLPSRPARCGDRRFGPDRPRRRAISGAGRKVRSGVREGDIGVGASSRNAGYVGRTFKYTFDQLIAKKGLDYAKRSTANSARCSKASSSSSPKEKIDCRLVTQGRFVMAASPAQLEELKREYGLREKHLGDSHRVLERKDQHAEIATDIYHGGIVIEDMAGLHPGLYHQGIFERAQSAGVAFYPRTEVLGASRDGKDFEIATSRGKFHARERDLCDQWLFGAAPSRGCSGASCPFEAYMIATEKLPRSVLDELLPGGRTFIDWNFNVDFIRRAPGDDRILFGGDTGVIGADLPRMAGNLRRKLAHMLPRLKDVGLDFVWTGKCSGTRDLYPHIGCRKRHPLCARLLLRGRADGHLLRDEAGAPHSR